MIFVLVRVVFEVVCCFFFNLVVFYLECMVNDGERRIYVFELWFVLYDDVIVREWCVFMGYRDIYLGLNVENDKFFNFVMKWFKVVLGEIWYCISDLNL